MAYWDLLSTASVIVALATFAGLALQRGIVVNLREQLTDARAEIEGLKTKRAEDKTKIHDLEAVVKIATGEVHWQAISDVLEHHHKTAEDHWKTERALLDEIRDILRRPQ